MATVTENNPNVLYLRPIKLNCTSRFLIAAEMKKIAQKVGRTENLTQKSRKIVKKAWRVALLVWARYHTAVSELSNSHSTNRSLIASLIVIVNSINLEYLPARARTEKVQISGNPLQVRYWPQGEHLYLRRYLSVRGCARGRYQYRHRARPEVLTPTRQPGRLSGTEF
jgi:hypothetical protein